MVGIETIREYWDRQPCNLHHSSAPVGLPEYFSEVRNRKYFVEPHIPRFAEFNLWRDKKVLDLGCGLGTMAVDFARAGAYVTAVDLSPRSIELAKSNAQAAGVNIDFHCHNIEQWIAPDLYDLIFSFGVLHHTTNPLSALNMARRSLLPHGELRVMVYHKHSFKALGVALRAMQPEAQAGCPLARAYTKQGAIDLLEATGFRVTGVAIDHIFPWRLAEYKQYQYVKALPWRWMPPRLFKALECRFGWHLLIKAVKE